MEQTTGDSGRERTLQLLFTEVNAHLRATEQKHLQTSVAFLTLLSLGLSITAIPSSGAGEFASWPRLTSYGILLLISCVTGFIQDRYRAWKQHYKRAALELLEKLGARDDLEHLPGWLRDRESYSRTSMSADNAFTYLTVGASLFLVVTVDIVLVRLLDRTAYAYGLAILVGAIWLVYWSWLRVWVEVRCAIAANHVPRLFTWKRPLSKLVLSVGRFRSYFFKGVADETSTPRGSNPGPAVTPATPSLLH